MPVTHEPTAPDHAITAQALAHEIRTDCDRALRRLDQLSRERQDVLLAHAREFIRHAAALSRAIERGRLGAVTGPGPGRAL